MKLRLLISLLLLLQQPVLPGQGNDAPASLLAQGDAALADGLWEIAEIHLRQFLAGPALNAEAKSRAAIHLVESLIRGGKPNEALELLGQSFVMKSPEASFWRAQALASQHRFSDALEIFRTLPAGGAAVPHRTEAGFTQASLQLALGQAEASLETLAMLTTGSDDATVVRIHLYQVEILLDLGRMADAREVMPGTGNVGSADRPLATFLEARLQLHEGHPEEAEAAFQELINHPQGQSLVRYHSAALGLADAIRQRKDPAAAALSLLAFLQDHPDSPILEAIFERLIQWLPEKPSLADPILESLVRWIEPPTLPATGLVAVSASGAGAAAAWPVHESTPRSAELPAYSSYARAIGLHRIATPEARAESRRLMNRLRLDFPGHSLADRALYQTARWLLDEGSAGQAFSILNTLRDFSKIPELKGEAAYLEARATCLAGDPKQAVRLFDEAASSLAAPEARVARLQSALARVRGGDLTLVQQSDKSLEADLLLERALSAANRPGIEEFLARFPDHPRASEARLAAAEAALAGPAPDLAFARDQLEVLDSVPDTLAPRLALARLSLVDRSGDSPAAMAAAQALMDTYPADPAAAEAAFTLGRNLFQAGSYNPSRLVLEKLAATETNPARAQAAWLLAARAAALGGTPQSKDEALVLFDKAIEAKGPLAPLATLEKSSHLIDMFRLAEASAFLGKWIKTLPENDPLQVPAGLLLGGALYAQGSGTPASMAQALAIYDKLLVIAKNQPALLNRLQYLRGMTLEQLPDPKDPAKKCETQAFEAFYSVLETTAPPAEWKYFELCGFHALTLLEKARRWQAAVNLARKIASFNGPGAKDAAERASKIQLEQMMW